MKANFLKITYQFWKSADCKPENIYFYFLLKQLTGYLLTIYAKSFIIDIWQGLTV